MRTCNNPFFIIFSHEEEIRLVSLEVNWERKQGVVNGFHINHILFRSGDLADVDAGSGYSFCDDSKYFTGQKSGNRHNTGTLFRPYCIYHGCNAWGFSHHLSICFGFRHRQIYRGGLLLYLVWQSFKEKETGFTFHQNNPLKYTSLYKKGILMNLLNPKVSLFFLALLPQFVDKSIGHIPLQMFLLGIIFLVQAFAFFVAVSMFSEKLGRVLFHHSFLAKRMNIIKGSILGMIGIQIALSEK